MIEVRMRHQHQIDGRQISHPKSGTPQPLQHKEPAREVRIEHHALPAHLHQEAGMSNERDAQFAVRGKTRHMRLPAKRSHGRMPHQAPELRRALAEGPITKRCFDHPVAGADEAATGQFHFNWMEYRQNPAIWL